MVSCFDGDKNTGVSVVKPSIKVNWNIKYKYFSYIGFYLAFI